VAAKSMKMGKTMEELPAKTDEPERIKIGAGRMLASGKT